MADWPLVSSTEIAGTDRTVGDTDEGDGNTGYTQWLEELRVAHQRVGELEATVSQRDRVIRGLRRRLHDLEGPFWERRTRLDEELERARLRISELEGQLAEIPERSPVTPTGVARLEQELAAMRATRTFRYSARARAWYGRALGLRQRA